MNKELNQCACQCSCGCGQKLLTIEECVNRLEALFKWYQKDSEFYYQLYANNSPFNTLKQYAKVLDIIKENCRFEFNERFVNNKVYLYEVIINGFLSIEIANKKDFDLLKKMLYNNTDKDLINNTFGLD